VAGQGAGDVMAFHPEKTVEMRSGGLHLNKELPFIRGDVAIFIPVGLQEGFGITVRVSGFELLPFDDAIAVGIDLGERGGVAGERSTGRQEDGRYGDQTEFMHHDSQRKRG
jgi:hypothetical protein